LACFAGQKRREYNRGYPCHPVKEGFALAPPGQEEKAGDTPSETGKNISPPLVQKFILAVIVLPFIETVASGLLK